MCTGGDAVCVSSAVGHIHAFMDERGVDARIAGDPRFVFIIAFGVTVGIVEVHRFVSMVHSVGVEVAVRSVVDHRYACTAGSGPTAKNVVARKYVHMVGR